MAADSAHSGNVSPAGEPLNPTAAPVTPRPSASVLIVRDAATLEVLLLQRSLKARFMAGAWVFPGGTVDLDDGSGAGDEAHRICAAREVMEESAIDIGDPAGLVPFARWITPEIVAIRFDTRFYIVAAPPGAEAVPDGGEMIQARWITPADAIRRGRDEEMLLHFPTLKQLERLAPFESAAQAVAAAAASPVKPILPKIVGTGDDARVALPGDPDYPA